MELRALNTKICKTCKKKKPLSEFKKDCAYKDRYQSECKRCRYPKERNWYNTWAKNNPDKIKKKNSRSYHKNQLRRDEQVKSYLKEKPWLVHLYEARTRCKSISRNSSRYYVGKGIKCYLTVKQIQELWFRDEAFSLKEPTLDRKEADKNYTFKNCQFIEKSENSKKAYQEGLKTGIRMWHPNIRG